MEGIEPLKPEDAKTICQLFDINDSKLLMGIYLSDYVRAASSSSFDWPQLAGIQKGLVKDLRQIAGYQAKAENVALTDADFAQMKAMDNPFYLEAFTLMQKKAKDELLKYLSPTLYMMLVRSEYPSSSEPTTSR